MSKTLTIRIPVKGLLLTLTALATATASLFLVAEVSNASSVRLDANWETSSLGTERYVYGSRECVVWSAEREDHPELTDEEFYSQYCDVPDYPLVTDSYGPRIKALRFETTITVRNLPTGWQLCESLGGSFEQMAIQDSMAAYYTYFRGGLSGFGSVTTDNLSLFRNLDWGASSASTYYLSFEALTPLDNRERPVFTPAVFICGPDSKTPSGTGWKFVQGKPITLPPVNRW